MSERQDDAPPSDGAFPQLPAPPRTVFVGPPRVPRPVAPLKIPLPGSKYYTLRFLLNAALATGESHVRYPAMSDDTFVLARALTALGATIRWERDGDRWNARVRGCGGRLNVPPGGVLELGNAGAVLRLLLGVGALLPKVRYTTDHPGSLGARPNADLLDALRSLGLRAEAQEPGGRLPITLSGGPPEGGEVAVSGARSSQFLSALLYLAPLLQRGLTITVRDTLRSAPLALATLRALALAGIQVEASADLSHFVVPGRQHYAAADYVAPGDGPSAAALVAATLTVKAPLRLERFDQSEADAAALLRALTALAGSAIASDSPSGGLDVAGDGDLRGARIDGDSCIDSVPALVALACFARGDSQFLNVATLRLKESDRIGDLCGELRRAGCDVEPGDDTITVHGTPEGIEGGVTVDAHDDHRLAQALAVVALRSRRGLTITGADAVAKSYPSFFDDLASLGADVRPV